MGAVEPATQPLITHRIGSSHSGVSFLNTDLDLLDGV
jgi:hypothetical protein